MTEKNRFPDLPRRTVLKGAAWSVPVIAAATAVPMASASAATAVLRAQAGGAIDVNPDAKTATGTFSGSGISIANVKNGPWETGELSGSYIGAGIWDEFVITKPDGTPFVAGEVISHGGVAWTVTEVESDEFGTWSVYFTAPSQSVSADVLFLLPPAIYSGSWSGTPTKRNPVAANVSVTVVNVNGGLSATNGNSYP